MCVVRRSQCALVPSVMSQWAGGHLGAGIGYIYEYIYRYRESSPLIVGEGTVRVRCAVARRMRFYLLSNGTADIENQSTLLRYCSIDMDALGSHVLLRD